MIDLLDNVEFDLHIRQLLTRPPTVASYFLPIFVIICDVGIDWLRKLYMGDLKIIGSFTLS